jgi:predicted GNAT family N-acyltransferase
VNTSDAENSPLTLTFAEFAHGSPPYEAACVLRNDVLRRPLGLVLSTHDVVAEEKQWHFGLFQAEELLACVIAHPVDGTTVKLRQMAVKTCHQGRGLGRILIGRVEDVVWSRGVGHIWLNARCEVTAFYDKLGYRQNGPVFSEVGIPHVRMDKWHAPHRGRAGKE